VLLEASRKGAPRHLLVLTDVKELFLDYLGYSGGTLFLGPPFGLKDVLEDGYLFILRREILLVHSHGPHMWQLVIIFSF
jgi:hypothetical protein